ncbi:MAG TPA: molybdopterin-guanine dinucleotide biosynthesis protein B [Syntrophales bacterium]|nr:molybdopterin-guanine dinucleotide biosynthesis protein B [Syntrophales bacterium]HOM06144.1 molybdopterin-guanine dinucleotide biosynthesis protein B [Syntrophales bacterium]HON98992.1 molybdopterin-guanine dinucleotide biosynthesis protein B [Syntrophales bacterium]HPC00998.1 molybdopterin-guanine dinucleotide biosynthesis protein B [Syntrophales bacterium]HPQ05627.1 molybdopterin-guanine dinucleotide biosynthesis protein B [Syntrophales bacterium]
MEENGSLRPIVAFVGPSGVGKTTLLEGVIGELVGRGWKVATIKHNRHGFQIDHEGKDSWRHKRAGARVTVLASPRQTAVVEDTEEDPSIDELCRRFIRGCDVVLVEGYKDNPYPKVEVYRRSVGERPLSSREDNLIALAGDEFFDLGVPFLDVNDARSVADFIEERYLRERRR